MFVVQAPDIEVHVRSQGAPQIDVVLALNGTTTVAMTTAAPDSTGNLIVSLHLPRAGQIYLVEGRAVDSQHHVLSVLSGAFRVMLTNQVAFCLGPPLSGTVTFSGLRYLGLDFWPAQNDAPTIDVAATGLPPNETVGVTWRHVEGVRGYTIASFDTDSVGNPTVARVFRQAELPAKDIMLTRWDGHQVIQLGLASPC